MVGRRDDLLVCRLAKLEGCMDMNISSAKKKQPSTDGIMFQNIEFKSVINTIKQSDTCIQSSEEDQRYGIHLRYIEI